MSETNYANEHLDTSDSHSAAQNVEDIPKEKPSAPIPPAGPTFPDGGLRAWMTILGCFLVSFTSYGQLNAYGVFQTYYAEHQLSDRSASDISWIGSLQLSLIYFSGLLFGPAMDRYGSSVLLISGWLLSTFCLMMLSLSESYYQIFLSQGLGFGIGIALQFYPLLVIPAHWFKEKRALVMGIVVAGSSLSGVVFPIMLSRLFQSIGFPWAVRTLAFMCFALQGISIPFIKERFPSQAGAPRFDPTIQRDLPFLLHIVGAFFISFGLYTPFWYIELYGLQQGVNPNLSFYLISIMNASGIFGRVIFGQAGDVLGRFNVMISTLVLGTIAPLAIWTTSHTSGELIAFAVIFGFTAACYMSLAPACTAQLTSNPSFIGVRVGIIMTAMAPGILTGPSIGGAFISAANGSYIGLQCFVGAVIALGTACAVGARVVAAPSLRAKF